MFFPSSSSSSLGGNMVLGGGYYWVESYQFRPSSYSAAVIRLYT